MATMVKQIIVLVSSCIVLLIYCSCLKVSGKTSYKHQEAMILDTAINNIILRDTNSVINTVGNISQLIIEDFNLGECVVLSNKNQTEFFILKIENGGYKNQYCYYYLTKRTNLDTTKVQRIGIRQFITNKGAYLDMEESEFLKKYSDIGLKQQISADSEMYHFSNDKDMYDCKYIFFKHKLVEIAFGYQY